MCRGPARSCKQYKSGCTCTHARSRYTGLARAEGGETPHLRERWRKATPEGKVGDLDYEGGDATPMGKVAHSHTQGNGGGPLLGGRRHTQGKGGTQPHPRERWGTSTEGRDATPKAKAMGEVGDLDESTALTWQLTAKRPSRGACARTPAARRAAGRTRLARYAAHWSAGGTAVPAC